MRRVGRDIGKERCASIVLCLDPTESLLKENISTESPGLYHLIVVTNNCIEIGIFLIAGKVGTTSRIMKKKMIFFENLLAIGIELQYQESY